VWDEPSLLERPGAGTGALREYAVPAPSAGTGRSRGEGRVERRRGRRGGDRALAALEHDDPTPIFHELTVDRSRVSRREPSRGGTRRGERSWRDRDAVHVPEPHPGSGPLPVQDPYGDAGRRRGLTEVPTVPPPAVGGSGSRGAVPGLAESPEDELRRRAERRRRPLDAAGGERAGGRHTWRAEEARTGRHALRR
jgi:hypothetical protein